MIHLDYRGLIRLHWSAPILEELRRALVDTGRKADEQAALRHEQLLRASLPHAEVAVADVNAQIEAVAHAVRSKKDAHVAACARALVAGEYYSRVETVNLVTKNVRDFGIGKLAELAVEVSRPDDFLRALFERDATGVLAAFAALRATLRSAPTYEVLLERLAADGQVQTARAMRAAMQRKAIQP